VEPASHALAITKNPGSWCKARKRLAFFRVGWMSFRVSWLQLSRRKNTVSPRGPGYRRPILAVGACGDVVRQCPAPRPRRSSSCVRLLISTRSCREQADPRVRERRPPVWRYVRATSAPVAAATPRHPRVLQSVRFVVHRVNFSPRSSDESREQGCGRMTGRTLSNRGLGPRSPILSTSS
jgi:hypothetical protein